MNNVRADAPPSPGTASILVVDDDGFIRRQLARLLVRLGYAVTEAESGSEALGLVEGTLPDLVITDLSMPAMTGQELLARLKASERTRHIPVIVASGEDDSSVLAQCVELGANGHVAKPFEPSVLQALIRTALESTRPPR